MKNLHDDGQTSEACPQNHEVQASTEDIYHAGGLNELFLANRARNDSIIWCLRFYEKPRFIFDGQEMEILMIFTHCTFGATKVSESLFPTDMTSSIKGVKILDHDILLEFQLGAIPLPCHHTAKSLQVLAN